MREYFEADWKKTNLVKNRFDTTDCKLQAVFGKRNGLLLGKLGVTVRCIGFYTDRLYSFVFSDSFFFIIALVE